MKRILLFAAACLVFACTAPVQPEQKPDDKQDEQNPGGDTNTGDDTNPGGDTGDNNNPGGGDDKFAPEAWYETNYWERSDRERAGFRGPVKKFSVSGEYGVYQYNEAGNLTEIRILNSDGNTTRGEWMEKYYYDDNGRLVKKIHGRSTAPGTDEFDQWASLDTWTYEYNNPGKYVWVRPDDNSFTSFYAFRRLSPEAFSSHDIEANGNALVMKDLSAIRWINAGFPSDTYEGRIDYTYEFGSDGNMVYSYHQYSADRETGEILKDKYEYNTSYDIVYDGNYPVSAVIIAGLYEITSITWRDNGMPLRIESPDGIKLFSPDEKRNVCPIRWDCPPGEPHDSFLVFDYWETYKYNEAGDLVEMQERFNGDDNSENGWTRPTTWEFEYDSHGNWISYKTKYMIAFDGPEGEVKDGSLSRTIEYY